MVRVLLDHRMRAGGVGRYGDTLIRGLRELPEPPLVKVLGRERGASGLVSAPFQALGRGRAVRAARAWPADVLHGLHLELAGGFRASVVTIPDTIPLVFPASMPNPMKRSIYRRLLTRSISSAARVVTHSSRTIEHLEALGADRSRIDVIPHGVDPIFTPPTEDEKKEARVRYGRGGAYVAAISGTKAHKNLDGFDRTAALLRGPELEVVCRGPAPARPHAHYLGHLEDHELRLFYGGAEVFYLPSIAEGFGLPLLEATACGTAVVAGSNIGATESLPGAVHGVDVTDPSAAAHSIRRLIDDAELKRELIARGSEHVRTLTPVHMARMTLDTYRAAISGD